MGKEKIPLELLDLLKFEKNPDLSLLMVKLQFSCKLYNTITGEMKQLTNGEFVGLFGKI